MAAGYDGSQHRTTATFRRLSPIISDAGGTVARLTDPPTTPQSRDDNLPPAYSDHLDALSLAPLWTALHALLPNERVARAVPHCWRWREIRGPLLEAAHLVGIE